MLNAAPKLDNAIAARQRWMAALARSSGTELESLLAACPALPPYTMLRPPETGIVMTRGRAGGAGQAFNLGEMTATRCSVRTDDARIGHAYVAGRDARQAELAAVVDALLQDPARKDALEDQVIAPLIARQQKARDARARKAAATQVQFFTLATMRGG